MICGGSSFGCGGAGYTTGGVTLLRITTPYFNREKEEKSTMKVTYNGFTGELVKLEQEDLHAFGVKDRIYKISIYDSEHQVTHSFTGVRLEDVKFLGGVITFGG